MPSTKLFYKMQQINQEKVTQKKLKQGMSKIKKVHF